MRRKTIHSVLLAAWVVLLWDAGDVFAWGAVTHVHLAQEVLRNLSVLPAAIAAILGRHGLDYLYGCVAADVVFAKRMSRVKQFCHHWSTAFRLLNQADHDRSKAFAYGYLSHLAADTVAHGKYVPRQVMLTGWNVNVGHLYWEARADRLAAPEAFQQLRGFRDHDFESHHRGMSSLLVQTFLPYEMNRELFERINALTSARGWHRGLVLVDRVSKWELPTTLLADYHGESVDRILSVLSEQQRSALLREDPNGTAALAFSRINRRQLRRLDLRGASLQRRVHEIAADWNPRLSARTESPVASVIENHPGRP